MHLHVLDQVGNQVGGFLLFTAVGILGPGAALQRLLRIPVHPALVVPLGTGVAAASFWLSLLTGWAPLFPVLIVLFDLALLLPAHRDDGVESARSVLRGAWPALTAVVVVLAVTQYPWNRVDGEGRFVLDPLVPFDSAFHVGVTRELNLGYPPQVPGIAGFPLQYHLGIDLVRAAALRWAAVEPYHAINRLDVTLWALALVLALRSLARAMEAPPLAVHLVGLAPLLGDFSFVFAQNPQAHWWTDLLRGNLLLSLAHANPVIPALAMAFGALIALHEHRRTGRVGWLVLASVLGFSVAFFKVFLGAHLALGLVGAALLPAAPRGGFLIAGLLTLASTGLLALQSGDQNVAVSLAPFDLVKITRETLLLPPASGASFAGFAVLWIVASLGLRGLGLAAAVKALRASPVEAALAILALTAWPIGLLFRVAPPDAVVGQKAINDVAFLLEQGGIVLWIFSAITLARMADRWGRPAVLVAVAALALPSTVHFVVKKARFQADAMPAATVRAMKSLEAATQPGEVVMQRPGARFPPAPVVLSGRRVPYERFTPYLTQFASKVELERRHETVYRFFHTTEAVEAAAIAKELGTRTLCLYGNDRVRFELSALYEPVFEEAGAAVYRMK